MDTPRTPIAVLQHARLHRLPNGGRIVIGRIQVGEDLGRCASDCSALGLETATATGAETIIRNCAKVIVIRVRGDYAPILCHGQQGIPASSNDRSAAMTDHQAACLAVPLDSGKTRWKAPRSGDGRWGEPARGAGRCGGAIGARTRDDGCSEHNDGREAPGEAWTRTSGHSLLRDGREPP
jgi:hypothetical protein